MNTGGIRTSDSTDFSATSQHAYGKAVDFDVEGMAAAEVNEWLIANRNAKELRGISFIEMGVTWVRMDTRLDDKNNLTCWWADDTTKVYGGEV